MAKVGARVHIFGDYDGTGVKSAQRDIGAFGQQAEGFSKSFSKSMLGAGAALGGAFAVTAVAGNVLQFFGDSMAAALADEKAMRSLEIALQNVGAAHQVAPVESFIDALARETGVADDQLRPAFQKLVTATGDVALSQKNLQLAMDISADRGLDLEAVSLALAKGFSGSTTALGKLGAGIDANIIKSKDMDAITAALSAKFAGQAAAAADTYQGKINRLNVAVEEGKELIGTALLKAVDDISEAFGGAGGMAGAVDTAAQAMADFITGTAITVSGLDDFVSGITGASGGMITYSKATMTALKLAPGIGGLVGVMEDLVNMGAAQRTVAEEQAKANTANAFSLQSLSAQTKGFTKALPGLDGALEDTEEAADKTSKSFISLYESIVAARRATSDLGNTSGTVTSAIAEGVKTGGVPDYYKNLTFAYGEAAEKLDKVGGGASAAAKETYTFKEALAAVNESGLQQLKANLDKAQAAFDGFRTSISGSISGQLDFAGAADEAKKGGTSIVGGIVSQAAGITAFGEQLLEVLKTSLSEEAFLAVAALSAERGSALATELLGANGATLIEQLNTSVAAVGAVAEAVGLQAAEKWYGTGKKIAEDSITGFQDFMGKDGLGRKQLMGTMDRLADAAARQVRIDVMVTRSINEIVTRITQNVTGPQARAEGGPVIAGRSYVVGEVGPELFTPSTSGNITPNSAMGGNTYQITVQAGVGDPRAIGQQIVEYVKKFEKANGPVFAAA
jgi:hypothetical protein